MPNTKKISISWSETGKTVYAIIRREVDLFRLNDADGSFAAAPADPYLSLAEDAVIKGLYEVSEARAAWNDGEYFITVYRQAAGAPAPAADLVIGSDKMTILSDTEVDSVNISTIDTLVDAIKLKTDTINAAGTLIWLYTLTDNVTSAPIADATVILTSDSAGLNVLRTGVTNSAGVATFYFAPADSGMTVYVWRSHAGYNFTNPDAEVLS